MKARFANGQSQLEGFRVLARVVPGGYVPGVEALGANNSRVHSLFQWRVQL